MSELKTLSELKRFLETLELGAPLAAAGGALCCPGAVTADRGNSQRTPRAAHTSGPGKQET
jgi:hypothetical protein